MAGAVTRALLKEWILEALKDLGGSAHYVIVAKKIWELHKSQFSETDDMFFKWQYEMRWASQALRNEGLLQKHNTSGLPKGVWKLTGGH